MEIVQDYDKYPVISAVIDEDINKVNYYLKRKANVNETNADRNTALILAAYLGNSSICEFLIRKGAIVDYSNKEGKNAIMIAYENKHYRIVKILAAKGANIDLEAVSGTPYLYNSVSQNDVKMVRIMLDAGASTEKVNEFGDTPLQCAIRNNNVEIAEMLVEYGANIFDDKYNNYSVLMNACDVGNVNVVRWLIKRDSKLEHKSIDGRTALMIAAQLGHNDVVKLLLSHNADIESKDYYGANALMKAAQNGYHELVELLIEKGANIDATDDDGWTALHYACLTGEVTVIRYLIKKGINKQFRVDPITVAIESFQLSTVLLLSQNGFPLTHKLPDGRTYLELAEEVNCMSVSIFLRDVEAGVFDESKIEEYLVYDDNYGTVDSVDEELEGFAPTSFEIKKVHINTENEVNKDDDIFEFDDDFGLDNEDDSIFEFDMDSTSESEDDEVELNDELHESDARHKRLKLMDELSKSFNLNTAIDNDVKFEVDSNRINQDIKNDLEKLIKSKNSKNKKANVESENISDSALNERENPQDISTLIDFNDFANRDNDIINEEEVDSKQANSDASASVDVEPTDTNIDNDHKDDVAPQVDAKSSKMMDLEAIEKEILEIKRLNPNTFGNFEDTTEKTVEIEKTKELDIDDLLASIDTNPHFDDDLSSFLKGGISQDDFSEIIVDQSANEEVIEEIVVNKNAHDSSKDETLFEEKEDERISINDEFIAAEELFADEKIFEDKIIETDVKLENELKTDNSNIMIDDLFEIDEVDIEEIFSFTIDNDQEKGTNDKNTSEIFNAFDTFDFTRRSVPEGIQNVLFEDKNVYEEIKVTNDNDVLKPKYNEKDKSSSVNNKIYSEKRTVKPEQKPKTTFEEIVEIKNPSVTSSENNTANSEYNHRVREDDAEFINFEALSYDDFIPTVEDEKEELISVSQVTKSDNNQHNTDIVEELFRLNQDLIYDGKFTPEQLYNILDINRKYLKSNPIKDEDFIEIINYNKDLLTTKSVVEEELFDILKINILNQTQFDSIVDKVASERLNVNKQVVKTQTPEKLIDDVLSKKNHIQSKQNKQVIEETDDFITKTVIRALSLDQEYNLGKSPKRPDDSFSSAESIDGDLYGENIDSKEVNELIFANEQEEEIYKQYLNKLKPTKIYDAKNITTVDISEEDNEESAKLYAEVTNIESTSKSTPSNSSSANPHSHEAVRILNEMFNDKMQKANEEANLDVLKDKISNDGTEPFEKIIDEVKEYRKISDTSKDNTVQVSQEEKIGDEIVEENASKISISENIVTEDITLRTLLQDFVYAVNHNDTDLILGLQNIQFFISELEYVQISPLILAISNNNMILFDYFINVGAAVNIKVEKGFTPLMVAAQYNNQYAVEVLIACGAFIDDISDRDFTALMIAAQRGNLEAVISLCSYGADYYINSTCGNSALILATAKNRVNIVEFFIEEGFDLLVETDEGLTALDIAYAKNFHRLIQILSYAMYSSGY